MEGVCESVLNVYPTLQACGHLHLYLVTSDLIHGRATESKGHADTQFIC